MFDLRVCKEAGSCRVYCRNVATCPGSYIVKSAMKVTSGWAVLSMGLESNVMPKALKVFFTFLCRCSNVLFLCHLHHVWCFAWCPNPWPQLSFFDDFMLQDT